MLIVGLAYSKMNIFEFGEKQWFPNLKGYTLVERVLHWGDPLLVTFHQVLGFCYFLEVRKGSVIEQTAH